MKNNQFDRFSNYQDYGNQHSQERPLFSDAQRSNFDDGMSRSERNDYSPTKKFGPQNQSQNNLDEWPGSKTGPHFGKAPKNYVRSDIRIHEDVCEALRDHTYIDASEIEVEVKSGIVTLSGIIESRKIKRLTEDWVESMPGVADVINNLRVLSTPNN